MNATASRRTGPLAAILAALTLALAPAICRGASPQPGPPLTIQHAAGPIEVDGDLSDAGWQGIPVVGTWFETRVGDNVEPTVKNEGFLAYDDRYLYAAFRFEDPHPELIRAPIADRDQLSGNTDYGGLIVDSNNDGKSAVMFLANPNGLLYDAVSNDASGEDSSPDFYWESAGKVTPTGWTLEMRIPFSSLRYSRETSPTWGVMLYRNYPRDRHYQFFSAKLPRDVNCFICNSSKLTGLTGLPHGSHLVVAPYATAQRVDTPQGTLGSPLANGEFDGKSGVDLKWSPLASLAIDATVNPDFSQVETDAAQIGANERFALFYPEKRSFFLEGIDLFSTPFQAVYTRSINSPDGGLRATGRIGNTSYTALGAHDLGKGVVILPGPEGSGFALQDFHSNVGVLRVRHDLGQSFVSLLATGRVIDHGGDNVVIGPDFQWRPLTTETITGQALVSSSHTPNRTDLAGEWDGRTLEDVAGLLRWSHGTRNNDVFIQGQHVGPEFRTDEGFMPQVGFREAYFQAGYTVRPKTAFFNRIRMFTVDWYDENTSGTPLARRYSVGAGMDGRWGSFVRFELNRDDIKVGSQMFDRFRPEVVVQLSPGRVVNAINAGATFGDEIDFANARKGSGVQLNGSVTVRPSDHLELRGSASTRWLNVEDPILGSGRLFLAQIERVRASYSFNARSFVRLIGQYAQTTRNTSLYTYAERPKVADLNFSGLVAYKLNWQTVIYLGYGDDQKYEPSTDALERRGRQAFAKVSYALQR